MGSEAKYHHLIPQTYMSAWANSSGTLLVKDLHTGETEKKINERTFSKALENMRELYAKIKGE